MQHICISLYFIYIYISLENPKWILRGFKLNSFIGMWSKSLQSTWRHLSINQKTHSTPSEKVAWFKESRYLRGIFNSTIPREWQTTQLGCHRSKLAGRIRTWTSTPFVQTNHITITSGVCYGRAIAQTCLHIKLLHILGLGFGLTLTLTLTLTQILLRLRCNRSLECSKTTHELRTKLTLQQPSLTTRYHTP